MLEFGCGQGEQAGVRALPPDKTLDALGVQPDSSYRELAPGLRQALVVGRRIADS
jgi:hypothetical protein